MKYYFKKVKLTKDSTPDWINRLLYQSAVNNACLRELNNLHTGDFAMSPTENASLKEACQKLRITQEDSEGAIRDYLCEGADDAEDVLFNAARIIIELFRNDRDTFNEVREEILKRMVKTDIEII